MIKVGTTVVWLLSCIFITNIAGALATTNFSTQNTDTMARVAVVTGGNKGIGYAIVKALCQQFDGIVYLTARDEVRGKTAVNELKKSGFESVRFHQLDVNDVDSVNAFREYLNNTHGGLDLLVNNAAIAYKQASTEAFSVQASETIRVNYFSLLRVCHALFPLLKPHARVVHLSSSAGHLSHIVSQSLKAQLSDPEVTEEQISKLMQDFVEAAGNNTHVEQGWPNSTYIVSKVGVSALTRAQQRAFDIDLRQDLVVNAVHPGYVDTDMTSHKGHLTPERGAQSTIFAALLPENTDIKGKYIWHDNQLVDWVNGPMPAQY